MCFFSSFTLTHSLTLFLSLHSHQNDLLHKQLDTSSVAAEFNKFRSTINSQQTIIDNLLAQKKGLQSASILQNRLLLGQQSRDDSSVHGSSNNNDNNDESTDLILSFDGHYKVLVARIERLTDLFDRGREYQHTLSEDLSKSKRINKRIRSKVRALEEVVALKEEENRDIREKLNQAYNSKGGVRRFDPALVNAAGSDRNNSSIGNNFSSNDSYGGDGNAKGKNGNIIGNEVTDDVGEGRANSGGGGDGENNNGEEAKVPRAVGDRVSYKELLHSLSQESTVRSMQTTLSNSGRLSGETSLVLSPDADRNTRVDKAVREPRDDSGEGGDRRDSGDIEQTGNSGVKGDRGEGDFDSFRKNKSSNSVIYSVMSAASPKGSISSKKRGLLERRQRENDRGRSEGGGFGGGGGGGVGDGFEAEGAYNQGGAYPLYTIGLQERLQRQRQSHLREVSA